MFVHNLTKKAKDNGEVVLNAIFYITIRLSIFLTLARACDKRFSADHDAMLSLLIKAFGPWAFTFYQTVFLPYFQKGSGQNIKSLFFSDY